MSLEAAVIRRAAAAGVAVPDVIVDTDGPGMWGSSGIVMARVEGETLARRILRDDEYAMARTVLAKQCGRFLAELHSLDPSTIPGIAGPDPVGSLRERLRDLDEPNPTFEFAMRWLGTDPPAVRATSVVHGDFRLGNLVVGPDGLRAVLDWELVHHGDPLDLHGGPTALELLEAVREFLVDVVMPGSESLQSFHARVAANAVAIVARELAASSPDKRRAADLAPLGVSSEGGFAAAIMRGDLDGRRDEVIEVLVRGVAEKLAVANPPYLRVPMAAR